MLSIKNALEKHKTLNVYELSRILGWSYGKTERKISWLVQNGEIYSIYKNKNGRNVKLLSLTPINETSTDASGSNSNEDHEIVKKAFLHLYGIFKELKHVKIDPTKALLSYATSQGIDYKELIDLFDKSRVIVGGKNE
ncbi:MAG: hypothetical protein ACTSWN_14265 [Promethearchaeota archaeon]